MVGTRGVPARYGGFETAIEEIGSRLAARGHQVVVFCRPTEGEPRPSRHLGMELVWLPALRRRSLETLSHTALSVISPRLRGVDAAVVFNAANAPFLPLLRARGIPFATHVDGLEWRRAKWGGMGKRYYRTAESLAVRWSDALIADAQGIADYYTDEFAAPTRLIAYGAPVLPERASLDRLVELDLETGGYHLIVARFEPENHVLEQVRGYVASAATKPLIVVGSAPYADDYTAAVHAAADDRVRFLGGVWDQQLLDQLYAGALSYLHGHSVGGTNPSLLRAAGAGAAVTAWDVDFNREVLGSAGRYFGSPDELARQLVADETDRQTTAERARAARASMDRYDWDDVAVAYERLCLDLMHRRRGGAPPDVRSGWRRLASGRRGRIEADSGSREQPDESADRPAVLVGHPGTELYGSDRMALETVTGLVEHGARVTVALPDRGPLAVAMEDAGARVEVCPVPVVRKSVLTPRGLLGFVGASMRAAAPMRRLIRAHGADGVHVSTITVPWWLVVGRLSGRTVTCHVHEAEGSQPRIVRWLLSAPVRLAHRVVVNSRFAADVLCDVAPALRSRLTVVPNGVAGPPTEPESPRRELTPRPRLLFVGRLSPRKGPQVAIEAVDILSRRGVEVELNLLGAEFAGYEWFVDELRAVVRDSPAAERIDFLGFRSPIWPDLAAHDIVVVPSIVDEPFGNTAVEAMLAARPLIVSDTSGLREAADGYAAVRRVRPDDAAGIADAVESLIAGWDEVAEVVGSDRREAVRRHAPEGYRERVAQLVLSSSRAGFPTAADATPVTSSAP